MDGSNYFGDSNNMGNERGSGSSSRRGKKNNRDKPKQPQRGLGVAQLEKIRLHGDQMAYGYHPPLHNPYPSNFINDDPRVQTPYSSIPSSSFSYSSSSTSYSASHGLQSNIVMGLPQYERTNIIYGDCHPIDSTRWEHANATSQSNITKPLLNLYDSQYIDTKKHRSGSTSSQNSESSDSQEPDLELRLSL